MQKQENNQQDKTTVEKFDLLFSKLLWGGLIAVCILILQAFVPITPDVAIYISLGAVALAIPLLAGSLLLHSLEESGIIENKPWTGILKILAWIGIVSTLVGVDAALWHVHWLIGVLFLVSALVTSVVFSRYISKKSGLIFNPFLLESYPDHVNQQLGDRRE